MKCYYKVLEVTRNATDDEIKKAYRKQALKLHPDKNLDTPEEAKEQFQILQEAYNVLCDRHERAWYDNHREDILKGGLYDDYVDNSLNIFKFFSPNCFKGYGDDEKGFYTVYRRVFEKVAAEDAEFIKDEDDEEALPGFGDSCSSYEDVQQFYAYWQSYVTKKSYVWLEPNNLRQAPERYTYRLMEKENKKVRDKAKKERNEEIRNLVAFVRKRDKRVQAHFRKLQEIAKENKKKAEERQRQQFLERQKMLKEEYEKQSDELKKLEENMAEEYSKYLDMYKADEDEDSNEMDLEGCSAFHCTMCNKIFKTVKAFMNHEKSKKHKDMTAVWMKFSECNKTEQTGSESEDDSESLNIIKPDANDVKTSDEERISNSDSNSEKKKCKSQTNNAAKSPLGEGYILGQDDSKNKEDGYLSDTPDEELLSDQEDDFIPKSKKKKKKNKNIRISILEDSDEDDKEVDLLLGLSKKQRKKHQKQQLMMNMLQSGKRQSNAESVNIGKDKDAECSGTVSLEGNQGKAEESDDESPQETVSPLPGKKKGKKAKELRKAQRQAAGEARESTDRSRKALKSQGSTDQDLDHTCETCSKQFSSKNKLFEHLKKAGHSVYIPPAVKNKQNVDKTGKAKGKSNKNSD